MTEILSNVSGSKDVQQVLIGVQKLRFDKNDENTNNRIMEFYEDITGKSYTQDERIMIMSSLNQLSEFSCWLLGDFLSKEESLIHDRYIEWEESGADLESRPLYKSLNGFLDVNSELLGISRSKAYYCRDIRDKADLDTLLGLGVKQTIEIIKIKDDTQRKRVMNQAIKNDWDFEKTKEKVFDINAKIKSEIQNDRDYTQERVMKSHKFNIELDGNKGILIQAKTEKERNNLVRALNYYERAIKNYLDKCE